MQYPHLEIFTHKELLWTIDFNLEVTNSKQHTSLQIKSKILLMGKNTTMTQITSSHANSLIEMKKGNCYIHLGIIISNFLGFGLWNNIDLVSCRVLCFWIISFFCMTLFCCRVTWVFFNCYVVSIIAIMVQKTIFRQFVGDNRGNGF
jgi:hypothetical protein